MFPSLPSSTLTIVNFREPRCRVSLDTLRSSGPRVWPRAVIFVQELLSPPQLLLLGLGTSPAPRLQPGPRPLPAPPARWEFSPCWSPHSSGLFHLWGVFKRSRSPAWARVLRPEQRQLHTSCFPGAYEARARLRLQWVTGPRPPLHSVRPALLVSQGRS